MFGVRLESLAARDCRNNVAAMSNPDLPIVFDQLIRYLRVRTPPAQCAWHTPMRCLLLF